MGAAIETQRLGKCYQLSHNQSPSYDTLRDWLAARFRRGFRPIRQIVREDYWALREIDLQVDRGEKLGLVGANGAGKSTLLKLLSRITAPSEGRLALNGRVASLLEVGTGFHPELTGRENIFLNGSILGMRKKEVVQRFDEIVAFSGVEQFLDTPVKRYSSGMYTRLAFAVAAHLESEILLVDEVLAVGDAWFQKKCMSKMEDMHSSGRTVVLVSHNMSAIRAFCDRAIWLDHGRIVGDGDVGDVVHAYGTSIRESGDACSVVRYDPQLTDGERTVVFHSLKVSDADGNSRVTFDSTEAITVSIEIELTRPVTGLLVGFELYAGDGSLVFQSFVGESGKADVSEAAGRDGVVISTQIPPGLLANGSYHLTIAAAIHGVRWLVRREKGVHFGVTFSCPSGEFFFAHRDGAVAPMLTWSVQ